MIGKDNIFYTTNNVFIRYLWEDLLVFDQKLLIF